MTEQKDQVFGEAVNGEVCYLEHNENALIANLARAWLTATVPQLPVGSMTTVIATATARQAGEAARAFALAALGLKEGS